MTNFKLPSHLALFALMMMMMIGLCIVGCEDVKSAASDVAAAGEATGEKLPPRIYPADMERGQPLDLEIVRANRKQIWIDNRTAQPYHNVQLWLNGQYGATIDEIPIGSSSNFNLVSFINQHGEEYRVGSILEPEKARTVVLADMIIDGKMHKLYVRLPRDWQQP